MTVLLMLLMIVAFLTADRIVQRRRTSLAAAPGGFPVREVPAGVALAPNHTWVKVEKGVAVIGIDEFLHHMLGAVGSLVAPGVGTTVAPEAPALTLGSEGRSLRIASPVTGRVVDVNSAVLRDPATAGRDPYGAGWVLRVAPDRSHPAGRGFLSGVPARAWLREQAALAREFLIGAGARAAFAALPDGGEPARGALRHLSQEDWEEFARRFAAIEPARGTRQ
jgi:glycine cleavage system H protein